jgi:glutamate synthase domain-containing protein 2
MSKGGIIVQGNVSRGVGLGMTGGIIVVRGNVNGDTGQLLKGGTIITSGNAGEMTGSYMYNGEIIIAGNAGANTGQYMVGGVIYVGGEIGSLGANTLLKELTPADEAKLSKYFKHYGITNSTNDFKKIMPVEKRPLKDKLLDLDFDAKHKITDSASNQMHSSFTSEIIKEISNRTKTGLLGFNGEQNSNIFSTFYLDQLAILPNQIQEIRGINVLEDELDTKIKIGNSIESPLELEVPILLVSRGAGVVSKSCKMAQMFATGQIKSAFDTGGITFPEEFELKAKHGGKLIHQWASGRLGVNEEYLLNSDAVEIVLGTNSLGGSIPIIPAEKMTPELATNWNLPEGVDFILPRGNLDFDVPADLKRHVELIREITNNKVPVLIRLIAGDVYEDTKLAVRAGVDAIILDGSDICNRVVPAISANSIGEPACIAIQQAKKALEATRADKKGVKLLVSGLFRHGGDIFKLLSLGADGVVLNSTTEVAMGCDLCGDCMANDCPKGIATTHPEREIKLDWVDAGQRLTTYLKTILLELKSLMSSTGHRSINDLTINDLRALDYNTAAVTGAPLAGYDKVLPMWEH